MENIAAIRGSNFTRRIPHDRFLDGECCEKEKYYRNSVDNSNRVSSNYRKIKYKWIQLYIYSIYVNTYAILLFSDFGQSEYVKKM